MKYGIRRGNNITLVGVAVFLGLQSNTGANNFGHVP